MTDSTKILILGIGNPLLSDDGVGLRLLEEIQSNLSHLSDKIDFVDGGTQGMMLLGFLDNRPAAVLLDAIQLGASPGTVHILDAEDLLNFKGSKPISPHEGGAPELIKLSLALGELPPKVIVIGIEPEILTTNIGLSETIEKSIPEALAIIKKQIEEILRNL
jgi:hydrogenase maturation protease